MPFKSKAQQRFMFSQHPEMAKEWADKTPDISKLPEHVKGACMGTGLCEGGCMYEGGNVDAPGGQNEKDKELMDHMESSMHGGGCLEESGEGYADGGEVIPSDLGKIPSKNQSPSDEHESMLQMLENKIEGMHDAYKAKMEKGGYGTFPAFEQRIKELEGKVNGMAAGGEVTNAVPVPDQYTAPVDDPTKKKVPGFANGGDPTSDYDTSSEGDDNLPKAKEGLWDAIKDSAKTAFGGNDFKTDLPGDTAALLTAPHAPAPVINNVSPVLAGAANKTATPLGPVPGNPAPVVPAAPVVSPASTVPPRANASTIGETEAMPNIPDNEDMKDFFEQGAKGLGEFTPEREAEAQAALLKGQQGPLGTVGKVLNNASSNIMQGVARAGANKQTENEEERNKMLEETGVQSIGKLGQQKTEQIQAQISLQEQNPNSPLSQAMRQMASKVLGKNIPANMSGAALEKLIPGLGELAYHQTMVGVQTGHFAQEHETQLLARKAQIDEALTSGTLMGRLLDKDARSALMNESKMIDKELYGSNTKNKSTAGTPSAPYGPTVVKGNTTYEWSPISGKYHPIGK